jgi:multidrug efflux pump subunit AcrB
VPTALMPGLTGRLYQQFAITISIATVFSSINALTLSPALAGMLLRPSSETRNRFFMKFNEYFEITTGKYMGAVKGLVRRTGLVLVVFAGLMVAMFLSFNMIPGGFIPDEDQGYFFVNVELPDGASMERVEQVLDPTHRACRTTSRSAATRSSTRCRGRTSVRRSPRSTTGRIDRRKSTSRS